MGWIRLGSVKRSFKHAKNVSTRLPNTAYGEAVFFCPYGGAQHGYDYGEVPVSSPSPH
jgi:hypothetical protein